MNPRRRSSLQIRSSLAFTMALAGMTHRQLDPYTIKQEALPEGLEDKLKQNRTAAEAETMARAAAKQARKAARREAQRAAQQKQNECKNSQ